MDNWIDFGRGPLFRFAFSLMVLGLLRVFLLALQQIHEAMGRVTDRNIAWKAVLKETAAWLFPAGRLWNRRPVYSTVSVLFHVGLLSVPLFLGDHVLLWKRYTGFAWASLPRAAADWLTVLTIACGLTLFANRAIIRRTRTLSRFQDYLWPPLLLVPFVTGYLCSHAALSPAGYRNLMLIHVWSAGLIMIIVPFTKVSHCVLWPFSQLTTAVAWKFVPGAGDRVAATLGYGDKPSWLEKSRLTEGHAGGAISKQEVSAR